MVTHMKATIDIADGLLEEAKDLARKERTTRRALTEEGLRLVIAARKQRKRNGKFKPVVMHGTTPPEVFENLHELILSTYEDRMPPIARRRKAS